MIIKASIIAKTLNVKASSVYMRMFEYDIPTILIKGKFNFSKYVDTKYVKYIIMERDDYKIETTILDWIEKRYTDDDLKKVFYEELDVMSYNDQVSFCIRKQLI